MAAFPTLDDVAGKVGVSARTVSRVLRDEGGYSTATEQRVRAAVEELRYFPDPLARALSRPRSDTIAVVAPDTTDPTFAAFAGEVQRCARSRGLVTLCASTFGDAGQQRRLLTSLRSLGVGGAIVHPVADTHDDISRLSGSGFVVVALQHRWSGPGLTSVSTGDPESAGDTAATSSRPTFEDDVRRMATCAVVALQQLIEAPDMVVEPISSTPERHDAPDHRTERPPT